MRNDEFYKEVNRILPISSRYRIGYGPLTNEEVEEELERLHSVRKYDFNEKDIKDVEL